MEAANEVGTTLKHGCSGGQMDKMLCQVQTAKCEHAGRTAVGRNIEAEYTVGLCQVND